MAEEGSALPELLDALRWRWKLVALVAIPLLAGAVFYAESLPNQYTGEAIVVVEPVNEDVSSDLVRVGAPKYVAYATSESTVRRLADRLGEDPAELDAAVDANLATDTGNITLTATLTSSTRAAVVVNALTEDVVAFSRNDPLLKVRLVAPSPPEAAVAGPPRRLIEAAALFVGLLLGIAVAFVVERSRPRARTWRDIALLTGSPVVGRLPASRTLRALPAAALADPAVGSGVRTMRTNLERELGATPQGVLVVTSSIPGEGKTTVSGLFATTLARLDVRVLLMDADLRRPGLLKGFEHDAERGLSAVLRGRRTLVDAVQPGWAENLWVLPTTPDPDAGDLLARRMADVLREARARFDFVVVDSPPLLGTDDARTLATLADGVLLVVSAGTMAHPISEAVLALHTLRARIVGVVANRVREAGAAATYYYSTQSA